MLPGPLASPRAPAGGEDGVTSVGVVEQDEVALLQVQEEG